jgi:zinc transport system ATP-binding protein
MKTNNKAKITSPSNVKTSKPSVQPLHAHRQLLVDIDNLTVHQGGETALNNVSVCVHAGEFIGIVGPNGAGKTTLLKAVLGLLPEYQGHITKEKATVSYIPQHGNLYSGLVPMSVMEVVKLGSAGSAALATEALKTVGMEDAASKRFLELSGGQRQRVAIAKALASQPDILILDEPTTGIDEHSQTEFYETLGGLQKKGITIIMVAHEVDTVLKNATRIIALNRELLYDGPPELFEAEKHLPTIFKARHEELHHGEHHA